MAKFRVEARKHLSSSGKRDGVVIVKSTMFLDSEGEPLLWWIEKSARVEPSKAARKTLIRILGGS